MARAALVLALILSLAACGDEKVVGPAVSCTGMPLQGERPFVGSSTFDSPIPDNALIAPNSADLVGGLRDAAAAKGFVLSVRRYTVAVYETDGTGKRYDVPLTADYEDGVHLTGVPVPDDAEPDPSDDGHLAVVDTAHGCEYDFWQAEHDGDGWRASAGGAIRTDSDGIFRGPRPSARASGFALTAGLILPGELRSGEIDHPLVFAYPETRAGDPVPPATHSDGTSTTARAMPEGTRVRLDPALDLDTLHLPRWQLAIARALQRYGMYLADTGGTLALFAANPVAYEHDPYAGLLPDGDYVRLDGIPVSRFQVLRQP